MPPHLLPRLLLALLLLTAQSAGVLCGLNHAIERVAIGGEPSAANSVVHHAHHASHADHAHHEGSHDAAGTGSGVGSRDDLIVLDEHCHACSALAGFALLTTRTGWPQEREVAQRDVSSIAGPMPALRPEGANQARAPPTPT